MTRGDEDIEGGGGGAPKSFRHLKGGSEKIRGASEKLYSSKSTGGGAAKN